ncbi:unnamed protein product [Amoebophrya sp. A25]|nr:unnamed protein product [Amoebophrya sp. A25]|eukprot:GSA25T00025183001.1
MTHVLQDDRHAVPRVRRSRFGLRCWLPGCKTFDDEAAQMNFPSVIQFHLILQHVTRSGRPEINT